METNTLANAAHYNLWQLDQWTDPVANMNEKMSSCIGDIYQKDEAAQLHLTWACVPLCAIIQQALN